MVVDPGGRDFRMAQLLLHRRNVCFVLKRVGGRHRAQAVHAEAVDRDLRLHGVREHDLLNAVRCDGALRQAAVPIHNLRGTSYY
jgi:hypothetical protein